MTQSLLNSINPKIVQQKYLEIHRLYSKTERMSELSEAENAILCGDYDQADQILSQFETKDQLLAKLFEEIKGKPVHKTLKRVMENRSKNVYESLKGLFSLGTHICIELERGNLQYRVLLEDVLDSIHKNLA